MIVFLTKIANNLYTTQFQSSLQPWHKTNFFIQNNFENQYKSTIFARNKLQQDEKSTIIDGRAGDESDGWGPE